MTIEYKKLTEKELDRFIEMRINQLREEGAKEDFDLILILNQPIDRYGSYNFVTLRQVPLPGVKPVCGRFP
ncbi:MAG: hypothetical protein ACI4I1_02765 [Oscillospiraceae bacterium]